MEIFTIQLAFTISVSILLISTILSGLELAMIPKLYLDFVFPTTMKENKHRFWIGLHTLQALTAIFVGVAFYFFNHYIFMAAFWALGAITLYSYRLRKAGKDGSDQMRIITLLAFGLCLLLPKEQSMTVALYFIGAQALLAYTTSGIAKISSKYWRKGDVLGDILATYSYGVPKVSAFLEKHPKLEQLFSHAAIATMLAVPLSFFLPFQIPILVALFMILGFHAMTALLMGLNDFLFTFPLTFPGVIILHGTLFGYL